MKPRESMWVALHIHYHEDQDRVLNKVVRPAVSEALLRKEVERFFFIRYGAGGAHIRLRLWGRPPGVELAASRVRRAAESLFERQPSVSPFDDEAIRRTTQWLVSGDPTEADETVYPDNFLRRASFVPEEERYGGADLLDASLNFFSLSSLAALQFTDLLAGAPRSRRLGMALRLLLRQGLGWATSIDELRRLVGYAMEAWRETNSSVVEKAGQVFERQGDVFVQMLTDEFDRRCTIELPEAVKEPDLLTGAWQLSRRVSDNDSRFGIGASQLHMTANRLGLLNSEEVYLCRLGSLALERILDECPGAVEHLARILERDAEVTTAPMAPMNLVPAVRAAIEAEYRHNR